MWIAFFQPGTSIPGRGRNNSLTVRVEKRPWKWNCFIDLLLLPWLPYIPNSLNFSGFHIVNWLLGLGCHTGFPLSWLQQFSSLNSSANWVQQLSYVFTFEFYTNLFDKHWAILSFLIQVKQFWHLPICRISQLCILESLFAHPVVEFSMLCEDDCFLFIIVYSSF